MIFIDCPIQVDYPTVGANYVFMYANSPGLSLSLPNTEAISRSPVQVTKNHQIKGSLDHLPTKN